MTALEVSRVSLAFGGVRAVDDASMGFEAGNITGLIGPNGAGKTTLFNIISGLIVPDSGRVTLHDRDITGLAPWKIARLGIGRLFQDIHLFRRLTVLDNVMVAFKQQRGETPMAVLLTRWRVTAQERGLEKRTRELLDFVGIADKAGALAEDLSYGQQKLLSIARLLAADSEVLLLDEPTAGVNPGMIKNLLEVIRRMAAEGKTVIFIEHNMNVVAEIANWVYFMDNGQVTSFGLPEDVLGNPEVRKAYIGI